MRWESSSRSGAAVEATPRWFGPADRPLFGWVHRPVRPDTAVRAVVVVCPSLGQEAVFAHYPLRQLADDLAGIGCVVVRVDYDGTGDSDGDRGSVASWIGSIGHAVELGREQSDAPLVLLGFRLGALLAVHAAARTDVEGLVLWDAPRSGKQFLRELAIRQSVSVGPPPAETTAHGFAAMGVILAEEARAEVARLDLRAHRTLPAGAVLSLERPGVPGVDPRATDRHGRPLHRIAADDQDELLSRQAVPQDSIGGVVAWVADNFPVAHRLQPASSAPTQARTGDGIRERVTSVGPHGLFGIVTEPDGPAASTTVVFVPDSITPHSGLSRIWTDLARQWAVAGIRSLRFDLSGCADSPGRPGSPVQTPGLLAHLDDVQDALRTVSPEDPSDTVLVGLCSGAYLVIETALAVRPRGVAAVNPVLSFITPEPRPDPRRRALILTRRWLGRLLGRPTGRLAARLSHTHKTPAFTRDPNFAWDRALEACFWQVYLSDVARGLPDRVWRGLNALLTTNRLHRIVGRVQAGGTELLMIAGDPDYVRSTLGSTGRLRALTERGGLHVEHHRGLDHAMMAPGDTARVAQSLTRWLDDVVTAPVHPDPVPLSSAGGALT